ncbi:unnamed protein product [Caenorhabditis auriculariae]|uniref:Thiamin pyrophosphokinase thiamin-binding domain-containing protein n=1 Tax=Caenorhabditis auriculariae TaxID=2777116 RepID=A0A8S1HUI3_9PELO|nr:unnamed protein product [Caenorhabditis auriculariae]
MMMSPTSKHMRTMKPFNMFHRPEGSLCIWLNGDMAAERPFWVKAWNSAVRRVCTDGASGRVLQRKSDLKMPHAVCGDFDSSNNNTMEHMMKMSVEVCPLLDQNATDLQKTLKYCMEMLEKNPEVKCERIVLLGGLNGRFDHTMATLSTLAHYCEMKIPIYAIDGENLVFCLSPGESMIMCEHNLCSKKCGLMPLCQRTTKVTTRGMKWNLDDSEMEFGKMISTSNEIMDEEIYVKCSAPTLFSMEMHM